MTSSMFVATAPGASAKPFSKSQLTGRSVARDDRPRRARALRRASRRRRAGRACPRVHRSSSPARRNPSAARTLAEPTSHAFASRSGASPWCAARNASAFCCCVLIGAPRTRTLRTMSRTELRAARRRAPHSRVGTRDRHRRVAGRRGARAATRFRGRCVSVTSTACVGSGDPVSQTIRTPFHGFAGVGEQPRVGGVAHGVEHRPRGVAMVGHVQARDHPTSRGGSARSRPRAGAGGSRREVMP